jgi:hypothetical protein
MRAAQERNAGRTMTNTAPKIGQVREHDGPRIGPLYPGEMAVLIPPLPDSVSVTRWRVQPIPGFAGWWLRLRWRCITFITKGKRS